MPDSLSTDSTSVVAEPRVQFYCSLGSSRFRVVEVRGREEISRPYRFRLKLRTEASDSISASDLLGERALVSFQLPDPAWVSMFVSGSGNPVRDFCGILSEVSYNGSDDRDRYFTALLRPKVWQLGLNRRFRMFSQVTTQQIVTGLLTGMNVQWRLSQATTAHNYCVQYGESDLAFVSRLLAEDGLFYFFEHQYGGQPANLLERRERLVITDSIDAAWTAASSSSDSDDSATSATPDAHEAGPAIPVYDFDDSRGGVRDAMRINRWIERVALRPTTARSLDRHFQRPGSLADETHSNAIPVCTVADEPAADQDDPAETTVSPPIETPTDATWIVYPSGVADRFDDVAPSQAARDQLSGMNAWASRDAMIRAQRWKFTESERIGFGDVATLSAGKKFKLRRDGLLSTTAYYLVRVDHLVRLTSGTHSSAQPDELTYRNRFVCQPTTTAYRPPRARKRPFIAGLVPATVVVDGTQRTDDVCVDQYGRVKVVFPWQDNVGESSCWVRVNQFWAGNRFGAFFWPRRGHEVLVAFEHGDPDRPVIVGSLYNADNMPPLTLPELKLSCGIHSCTHKSTNPTEETSSVVFHDKAGAEYLELHSQTHLTATSETTDVKYAAGPEITFKGHHWLFDWMGNSGGGGNNLRGNDQGTDTAFKAQEGEGDSKFDVGEMFKNIFLCNDVGEVAYTVGETYKKHFGGNYETKFGANIWLGCDPVEFIEYLADQLGGKFGLSAYSGMLVPLLLGAGGQGSTLFGGKHSLQYGRAVDSHRGVKLTTHKPEIEEPIKRFTKTEASAFEWPAWTAVKIAVAILLATDFIVMMLTKAALAHQGKHWNGIIKFSEVWSLMLLPRLQGLLEFIESTEAYVGSLLRAAQKALTDAVNALSRTIRAATVTDGAADGSREAAEDEVKDAVDSVADCVRRLERSASAPSSSIRS
ncbi:MAG: type VI secretion system tip protein TssI/VgrG [Pirellulaceae bacterium]